MEALRIMDIAYSVIGILQQLKKLLRGILRSPGADITMMRNIAREEFTLIEIMPMLGEVLRAHIRLMSGLTHWSYLGTNAVTADLTRI